MKRSRIPDRLALLGALVAVSGLAGQEPAPQVAMERLGAADAWEPFRAFWRQIDQEAYLAPHHRYLLAQRFSLAEEAFDKALRQTERQASNPAQTGGFTLGDYALASLAELRLTLSSTLQPPLYTRMVMLPPDVRSAHYLRGMERIEERVAELGDLRILPRETLQTALEGLRMDVYRYCVLREAAAAHARIHPAPAMPDGSASAERAHLWTFFWQLQGSPVGSRDWFQRYAAAVDRLAEQLDPELRTECRTRQAALAASVGALEAFRPRLEALIADLERP